MKYLLLLCFMLLAGTLCMAQPHYPSMLANRTVGCDSTPWVLVLDDQFNGTTLMPHWITFNSWCGMSGGDHDNWYGSRVQLNRADSPVPLNLILDKNVVIANGYAHLRTFKETAQWLCNACTQDTARVKVTTGLLNLKYSLGGFCSDGYTMSRGKIAVRAKFSASPYVYNSIWLWHGTNGINELDVIEARYNRDGTRSASYNVHEWNQELMIPNEDPNYVRLRNNNPDSLPYHADASIGIRPRNSVIGNTQRRTAMVSLYGRNDLFRNKSKIDYESWHVYGMEWENNKVRYYVDDRLVADIPRYLKNKDGRGRYKHYADCNDSGILLLNIGYPWDTASAAQLRIGQSMDKYYERHAAKLEALPDSALIGESLIDYVKVWQKSYDIRTYNPVLDRAWTAWNDPRKTGVLPGSEPYITGTSDVLCYSFTGSYTIHNPMPGGTWELSDNLVNIGLTNGENTITVQMNTSDANTIGLVRYVYSTPEYPECDVVFKVRCGRDMTTPLNLKVVPTQDNYDNHFLMVYDEQPPSTIPTTPEERNTYDWTIAMKYDDTTIAYYQSGKYVQVPVISFYDINGDGDTIPKPYNLKIDVDWHTVYDDTTLSFSYNIADFNTLPSDVGGVAYDSLLTYYKAFIDDRLYFDSLVEGALQEHLFYKYELDNDKIFTSIKNRYIAALLESYYMSDGSMPVKYAIAAPPDKLTVYTPVNNRRNVRVRFNYLNQDKNDTRFGLWVYSALGKVVYQNNNVNTQEELELDTLLYGSGLYVIRLDADGRLLSTSKFVVD